MLAEALGQHCRARVRVNFQQFARWGNHVGLKQRKETQGRCIATSQIPAQQENRQESDCTAERFSQLSLLVLPTSSHSLELLSARSCLSLENSDRKSHMRAISISKDPIQERLVAR